MKPRYSGWVTVISFNLILEYRISVLWYAIFQKYKPSGGLLSFPVFFDNPQGLPIERYGCFIGKMIFAFGDLRVQ